MRTTARACGYLLIALALAAAGWDGFETLRGGAVQMSSLRDLWLGMGDPELATIRALASWFADNVLDEMLTWPAWVALAGPGAALVLAIRPRETASRRPRGAKRDLLRQS